jgi:hypothetical protein
MGLFTYFLLPKVSEMVAMAIVAMLAISALNWTTRKYVGPVIEAFCTLISGRKGQWIEKGSTIHTHSKAVIDTKTETDQDPKPNSAGSDS